MTSSRVNGSLRPSEESQPRSGPSTLFGVAGTPGTRLLAGPPRSKAMESLASHELRLGAFDAVRRIPEELREIVRTSGLLGRGGAEFPAATKFDVAAAAAGTPIIVVNASEGEPASRKDRTLLELRPHLVLDGADLAAAAVGADEIVIYLHRGYLRASAAIERALAQRREAGRGSARVRVIDAPARYVAGETSAVVSYLDGHGAIPRRSAVVAAQCGVANRPTIVNNTETLAHIALIARYGARWFGEAGTREAPGSTLITLSGAVTVPGLVVEILGPVQLGRVLETVGGLDTVPSAVLLGGYEGTWISGEAAWRAPLDRHRLRASGAPLGCGLVAVLAETACGIAETARLLDWLAGQSSGQCGPCVFGLPALGELFASVAAGTAGRRDVRQLDELAASIRGRGACAHPTGTVTLLESALETFDSELQLHLRGKSCDTIGGPHHFVLPRGSGLAG